jgi:hypothetical protein
MGHLEVMKYLHDQFNIDPNETNKVNRRIDACLVELNIVVFVSLVGHHYLSLLSKVM